LISGTTAFTGALMRARRMAAVAQAVELRQVILD